MNNNNKGETNMTRQMKRPVALLMSLVMVVSLFFGMNMPAQAATYIYNWGQRGQTPTGLSSKAEAFYAKNSFSYKDIAALAGSSSTSGVPSSELYKELQSLMKSNHTHITSYGETRQQYQYTDCQNGGGRISSFYSGTEIGPEWDAAATWNREHVWPNSKGLGGDDENDIMMLRPTSVNENSQRGNKAYGESGSYYNPNSESNGNYDLRGDVARITLYTYVRWGNTSKMWGASGVMESKEVLIKWMKEDPVDTWELGRNDSVEAITGTRNVFVDYPELAFELFEEQVPSNYTSPSGAGKTYGTVPPATPDNGNQNTGNDSGNTTTPDNSGSNSNTNQNTGSNQGAGSDQNTGSNQGANTNQNTGTNQGAGSNQDANTNQNADSNQEAPVVDTPSSEGTEQDTEIPTNTENKNDDTSSNENNAEVDDKNESADEEKEEGGFDMTWIFAVMLIVGIVALVVLIIIDKKGKKSE